MPTKHRDVQATMKTHLSQPTGVDAFDGQHGMSPAISSVISEADILSAIACIDTSEDISAMAGRETGANARPAITSGNKTDQREKIAELMAVIGRSDR